MDIDLQICIIFGSSGLKACINSERHTVAVCALKLNPAQCSQHVLAAVINYQYQVEAQPEGGGAADVRHSRIVSRLCKMIYVRSF